ncbi:MAG: phage virion morphogenesis protein [Gammaproteobacteria bacterium]|nr:phage virion morphogenesis protein [Gammaproteobacteria bacterium]
MIKATIIGHRETVERLRGVVPDVRAELRKAVERQSIKLSSKVKAQKLSGQVLNVRTGRLRRSINHRIVEQGTRITGHVGTAVEYAKEHEFGFKGVVTVREHLRKAKGGKTATVRAHSQRVNLPARSFLRSALAESLFDIRAALQQAAHSAAKRAFDRR